ncbi:MAG: YggT family protein [Magnetospirillum sp. WYHS-4]
MDMIVGPVVKLLVTVIDLYVWVVVAGVVLSWLVNFGVLNSSNRVVYAIGDFVFRATEPALRPIRNALPSLGTFDISPIILVLGLVLLRDILVEAAVRLVG